jgi:GxxExxY protein
LRISFEEKEIKFSEELYYPVTFKGKTVERGRFDFFVEEKIVLELKALSFFSKGHIDQVLNYLNNSGTKLALLISFGQNEVRVKRIVNFKTLGTNNE